LRVLITYNLVLLGHDNFGPIIANSISNILPSKLYGMFLTFLLWMQYKLHVAFDACLNYIMGCKYVMHVYVELWMVGICWALNSNQNMQANI
jgi:hypothetical protein